MSYVGRAIAMDAVGQGPLLAPHPPRLCTVAALFCQEMENVKNK